MAVDAVEVVPDLSDQACQVLLAAIDDAFQDVLRDRYGGGLRAALTQAGAVVSERVLRPQPVGVEDEIEFELVLRDVGSGQPAAGGRRGAIDTVPIGVISMRAAPERGAEDVHVVTELFDESDPNEAAEAGCLTTGVLLFRAPEGQAGQMPGGGMTVMRSGAALAGHAATVRQGGRGWLPVPRRGRVNRGGGLGSNGFQRSGVARLRFPVSRHLLVQLADRVAGLPGLGPALERVVVGFRTGDTGLS